MTERLDVSQYYKIFYNNERVNNYKNSPLGTSQDCTYFNQHGIGGDRKYSTKGFGIGYDTIGKKTFNSDQFHTTVKRRGSFDTFGTGFLTGF